MEIKRHVIDQDSPAFVERRLNEKKKIRQVKIVFKKEKEICTDLTC